jgi:hypothetical protein
MWTIAREARAMASEQAIVVRTPPQTLASGSVLKTVADEAKMLYDGGMFPQHKSPQAIATICLKAHELGIGPVWALQKFYIDKQGRIGTFSDNMLALALQRGITFEVKQCDDEACEMLFERWDNPNRSPMVFLSRFTKQDAQRAGLMGKDTYKNYPTDLLKWKAVARGLMTLCPDFVAGLSELTCMGAEIVPGPSGEPMPVLEPETGLLELDADFSDGAEAQERGLESTDDDDAEPCVADEEVDAFRAMLKQLAADRDLPAGATTRATASLLNDMGFPCEATGPSMVAAIRKLTSDKLTVLYQGLQDFDFAGGETDEA